MLIPPRYSLTPTISELLSRIESNRGIIDSTNIAKEIEQNIVRLSTLRSSLFSARIEGNVLTMDDIAKVSPGSRKKIEVQNILRAINWIKEEKRKKLTEKEILTLHKISMRGLVTTDNLGKFRRNPEAIFNSAGFAIRVFPPAGDIKGLIDSLIKYANSPEERFVPVRAAMVHFVFEKIHPFIDGSGRVGRLLIQEVLQEGGYGMKGILPLEEYLENHRSEYYRMLEEPEKEATDYLEFMLDAIAEVSATVLELLKKNNTVSPQDLLLPRRSEILNIIRDHKLMNFDQIKRRFIDVNERTLRYDLKKLQDQNFIQKLGTTRGVYYREKSEQK